MNLPWISNTLAVTSSLPAVNTCKLKLLVVGFGNTFTLIDSAGVVTGALLTGMLFVIIGQPVFARFDSLAALFAPVPQAEVYATLIVSPAPATALLVYLTLMTCEFTLPESKVPVEPTGPAGNVHNQPVVAGAVALADVVAGAV